MEQRVAAAAVRRDARRAATAGSVRPVRSLSYCILQRNVALFSKYYAKNTCQKSTTQNVRLAQRPGERAGDDCRRDLFILPGDFGGSFDRRRRLAADAESGTSCSSAAAATPRTRCTAGAPKQPRMPPRPTPRGQSGCSIERSSNSMPVSSMLAKKRDVRSASGQPPRAVAATSRPAADFGAAETGRVGRPRCRRKACRAIKNDREPNYSKL